MIDLNYTGSAARRWEGSSLYRDDVGPPRMQGCVVKGWAYALDWFPWMFSRSEPWS